MTSNTVRHGINARLAAFICDFDEKTLGELAIRNTTSAILDTLAVTTAGRAEPVVMGLEISLPVYAGTGGGDRPALHKSWREDDAALLPGTASHALDYDDVSIVTVCYPSAPVVSAMCAAICFGDASLKPTGREFIAALCVGTEVLICLGQAMGFRHYELGFHPTATLGSIGAAVGIAKLCGLNHEQTAHALSMPPACRVGCGAISAAW